MRTTGLDFGTSTTLVARERGAGSVEVMSLGASTTWMPSVAAPDGIGGLLIGEEADRSKSPIHSIKTRITNNQSSVTVQTDEGPQELDADEVATAIIREAVRRALALDPAFDFSALRVGCPAQWERHQRVRLKQILHNAGVDVALADILDEPVAAAIAWIDQRQRIEGPPSEEKSRMLVFDYGGGTLDVAVCEITWKNHLPEITVLACDGATDATGDVLDKAILDYVRRGLGMSADQLERGVSKAAIQIAVRRAKEHLSSVERAIVDLKPYGLPNLELTRQELENLLRPQLEHALELVTYCLRGAKLRESGHMSPATLRRLSLVDLAEEIDQVVLAGGMSQIPLVSSLLQAKFPGARVDHASEGRLVGRPRPQHAIVAGLVHDADTYDRLNLHRPGFDIRLSWKDQEGLRREIAVYEAHTRIYSAQDIFMDVARPRYYRRFTIPARTPSQYGRIEVTSESGEPLPIRIDNQPEDCLELRLRGGGQVAISLYVDGRLMISVNDEPQLLGRKRSTSVRIQRWHVVRGKARIVEMTSVQNRTIPRFGHPHK